MRNEFKLKKIAGLHSALYALPGDRKVAGIILPSVWEYELSASKVIVTKEGKLIRADRWGGYFIKPPTYYEIISRAFRDAAWENRRKLIQVREEGVRDWIEEVVRRGIPIIRLFYGGDPYHRDEIPARFWADLFLEVTQGQETLLQLWTANTGKLNELGEACRTTPRVAYISEAQAYRDLPLYCPRRVSYYWAHEKEPGAGTERDIDPDPNLGGMKVEEWKIALPDEAYRIWKDAVKR